MSLVLITSIGLVKKPARSQIEPTRTTRDCTVDDILEEGELSRLLTCPFRGPLLHELVHRHLYHRVRHFSHHKGREACIETLLRLFLPLNPLDRNMPLQVCETVLSSPTCICCFTTSKGFLKVLQNSSATKAEIRLETCSLV